MNFKVVTNPTPEDVRIFANLRSQKETKHFIAESEKVVVRLLLSKLEIISIYLTEEEFTASEELIAYHEQKTDCKIYIGSREEMEKIVGFSLHQRILAAAKIPKEKRLDEILQRAEKPLLFVILDEVCDAENIGAMIRTSFGMSATAIIIDQKSTSPWMRRAVRVSMGAVFELPILTVESIPNCIEYLKDNAIITFAATLSDLSIPIWSTDLKNNCAIVFGSEGHGIKKEIIKACEAEITIPMRDNIHSLNVGTALGIFLFEIMRQRT